MYRRKIKLNYGHEEKNIYKYYNIKLYYITIYYIHNMNIMVQKHYNIYC